MSLGVGPLLMLVCCGRSRLVIDDLQGVAADQALERLMIHIGVSDLALLIGAEMEYLASG